MASIQWTDTGVTYSFSNGLPAPGSRFAGWTPEYAPVEDRHAALGTGVEVAFTYRADYLARFDVREVPAASLGTYFALARWLLAGGSVTVRTGDASDRTYTCTLAPGTKPTLTQSSGAEMLYTATFVLRNTAAADMLCVY